MTCAVHVLTRICNKIHAALYEVKSAGALPSPYLARLADGMLTLMYAMQLINIYTLGNPNGIGVFFPNGLVGNINTPTGFSAMATGLEDFPASPMDAFQVRYAYLLIVTSSVSTCYAHQLLHIN